MFIIKDIILHFYLVEKEKKEKTLCIDQIHHFSGVFQVERHATNSLQICEI